MLRGSSKSFSIKNMENY